MLFCRRLLLGLMIFYCAIGRAAEALPATSFYTNFTHTHFVDTSGKLFNPVNLVGKVALFNFVYTQCSNVCPIQTKQLVEVYSHLPMEYQDKVVFVTISLDSQFDKPNVLKTYAQRMNAEFTQWLFLSGSYEDIVTLQQQLYVFGNPQNPKHPKFNILNLKMSNKEDVLENHMTILWAVDKQGTLIQRYSASPVDVKRLERELKQIADMM